MDRGIEKLARVFKVLGDYNRLGIVMVISKASRTVTDIINTTGMSQTLVSFHLRALRKAKIVTTRREGPFIYYSLVNPSLMDIIDELSHAISNSDPDKENVPETVSSRGW
ncbi:MAG: winged helix-turn-helix transcriptional regulator [Deferribacteres bacterium]|nr:winged helix-turn-helix transcriptional regulator [Deferribacteres bacterium]